MQWTLEPTVLNADYSTSVAGVVDEHGRFDVDLTGLLLTEPSPRIAIQLQSDGALPFEFECPVAIDSARWGKAAVYEIRATLRVQLRRGVVGRIVPPADLALRHAARAAPTVAVFEWSGGRPQVAAATSAACDRGSGDFQLQLESDRDYVLVAILDGCRPWTRVLPRSEFIDLGRVVLERGESIAGRASVAGQPVTGAVRARFKNAGASEFIQCNIAGRWLVWTGAAFEWESQGVISESSGRFELTGLAPASYSVELGSMREAYASAASLTDVVAPSRHLELGPRICRVELQVYEEGAPAAERMIEISEVGRSGTIIGTHRTDSSGMATLWVDPTRTTSVALAPKSTRSSERLKPPQRVECVAPGAALSMRVDF